MVSLSWIQVVRFRFTSCQIVCDGARWRICWVYNSLLMEFDRWLFKPNQRAKMIEPKRNLIFDIKIQQVWSPKSLSGLVRNTQASTWHRKAQSSGQSSATEKPMKGMSSAPIGLGFVMLLIRRSSADTRKISQDEIKHLPVRDRL